MNEEIMGIYQEMQAMMDTVQKLLNKVSRGKDRERVCIHCSLSIDGSGKIVGSAHIGDYELNRTWNHERLNYTPIGEDFEKWQDDLKPEQIKDFCEPPLVFY